jgi:hypothetical protein
MKQILVSAAVAALVSLGIVWGIGGGMSYMHHAPALVPVTSLPAASPTEPGSLSLRFTDALVEDVWIDASRTAGDDHRTLTSTDTSICFITKIEISGIQSPQDTNSCAMEIDEFTGFWDLVATVEEGGQSAIRCNARCLIWE